MSHSIQGPQGITEKSVFLDRMIAVLVIAGAAFSFTQCRSNQEQTGNLQILDTASGKVLGKWQLDESGVFSIEFIHSVNQTPVRETFRMEDGNLLLCNVRFYSFGAGMQRDINEGLDLKIDGEAMIISGFSDSFRELNLTVGTVSDHILFINEEVISLRELSKKNAITIQVK